MALIVVGTDKRCFCNCATKCVFGKIGSSPRCTKEEFEAAGFTTIELFDKNDDKVIRDFMCCDGDEKKVKLTLVRNDKVKTKFLSSLWR